MPQDKREVKYAVVRKIKRRDRHGHGGKNPSRTYRAWSNMRNRCLNPNNDHYHRYGGRGIKICTRWLRFINFLADMGECPNGLSLERVDNDGNYELENCKWATTKEQARNKSRVRLITFRGRTQMISEWARELGIADHSLSERLNRWPLEFALTLPAQGYHCRFIAYEGRSQSQAQWAREAGISVHTLRARVWAGWEFKDALAPLKYNGKRDKVQRPSNGTRGNIGV